MYIFIIGASSVDTREEVTSDDVLPVIRVMDSLGIKFPYIVLAQSIRETTYEGKPFNSPICKNNHNYFGMKFNNRGFAIKKERGHAKYENMIASFADYAQWQRQMLARYPYSMTSESDYYYFLEHLPINKQCSGRYAEDLGYVKAISAIVQTLKSLNHVQQSGFRIHPHRVVHPHHDGYAWCSVLALQTWAFQSRTESHRRTLERS